MQELQEQETSGTEMGVHILNRVSEARLIGRPDAVSAAQCSSVGAKLAGQAFWRDIDSSNGYILCLVAES